MEKYSIAGCVSVHIYDRLQFICTVSSVILRHYRAFHVEHRHLHFQSKLRDEHNNSPPYSQKDLWQSMR